VVVAVDLVLVVVMPRTWTVTALGVGTSVGMTIAGCWLAVTLRRSVEASVLNGARRALGASLVAALAAAAAGSLVAAVLPRSGVVGSLLATAVVAVVTLGGFVAVAAVLDRATVRLVLQRRLADG
jgi:putative peptidoglycan lipid II flippase